MFYVCNIFCFRYCFFSHSFIHSFVLTVTGQFKEFFVSNPFLLLFKYAKTFIMHILFKKIPSFHNFCSRKNQKKKRKQKFVLVNRLIYQHRCRRLRTKFHLHSVAVGWLVDCSWFLFSLSLSL